MADYAALSAQAGIDFVALKDKYSKVAEQQKRAATAEGDPQFEEKRKAAEQANAVLDRYTTCAMCQGTGIFRSVYNFRTMESNCEACDGDGIMMKRQVEEIIKTVELEGSLETSYVVGEKETVEAAAAPSSSKV